MLAVGLLAGCAADPFQPTSTDSASEISRGWGRPVSTELADFLDRAPPGASTSIASSPWGQDITLSAGPAYYAASGRECRRLTIKAANAPPRALACRRDDGWVYVEAVTYKGQSVGDDG